MQYEELKAKYSILKVKQNNLSESQSEISKQFKTIEEELRLYLDIIEEKEKEINDLKNVIIDYDKQLNKNLNEKE